VASEKHIQHLRSSAFLLVVDFALEEADSCRFAEGFLRDTGAGSISTVSSSWVSWSCEAPDDCVGEDG
jgi:hypothetical protein